MGVGSGKGPCSPERSLMDPGEGKKRAPSVQFFFSFLCTFGKRSCPDNRFVPSSLRLAPPVYEILDLPLMRSLITAGPVYYLSLAAQQLTNGIMFLV